MNNKISISYIQMENITVLHDKKYAIILFMIFVFWVANKQRRVIYYCYNDTHVITPLFINEYRFTYLDSSYIGNVIFK